MKVTSKNVAHEILTTHPIMWQCIKKQFHNPTCIIPHGQLKILLLLSKHETMTLSQIAGATHSSPPTISGILDQLEAKKMITRRRSNKNKREVIISLTTRGKNNMGQAKEKITTFIASKLQQYSKEELQTVYDSMTILKDAFSSSDNLSP